MVLENTEFTILKNLLDRKFAYAQWDRMLLNKWHIRSRKIVSATEARLLFLYRYAVATWENSDSATNYLTENQLTAIFRRVQEIEC